ncbi:response regulator [Actinomyces polynesiensis]|uniref:response regulator n=1 Tax=Actinomyces polynesiensis TaxID=1325934 RepID=UPI000AA8D35E|nr:response regulator transcription factor [Actinomyces polynesiensis]
MPDGVIRVLVADDHPVVRGGLVALLSTLDGVEIVGAVGDGHAAVREAMLTAPDVVVLDLRMPGLDGVEATARILADRPDVGILVLTMFDEDESVSDALAAGARGYLLKGAEGEDIERAIRAIASGAAILSPEIASRVLGRAARPPAEASLPQLAPRERDVVELLARGRPNPVIARELGIAVKTVENHVSSVLVKLGVATRGEAIVRAREAGFGT